MRVKGVNIRERLRAPPTGSIIQMFSIIVILTIAFVIITIMLSPIIG